MAAPRSSWRRSTRPLRTRRRPPSRAPAPRSPSSDPPAGADRPRHPPRQLTAERTSAGTVSPPGRRSLSRCGTLVAERRGAGRWVPGVATRRAPLLTPETRGAILVASPRRAHVLGVLLPRAASGMLSLCAARLPPSPGSVPRAVREPGRSVCALIGSHQRPVEGPSLAASRTAPSKSTALTASGRVSFGKIHEPLEVPDLLALQTESFDWLLGNERWQARVQAAQGDSHIHEKSGLEEIFEEISPIEDFSGSMSLSFRDHRFEPPKYSIDECKERDMTYAAPLFVTAEFMNTNTGEIKSQTVFMGDFPLMTERGTFVVNGTERVVVSQLVRSPGVYFERTADKTSDKDVYSAKVIPSRGAWLEFEIDKRDMVGVRIDRKRKQSVTVLLKALGWSEAQILEEFGDFESMRQTLEKDHTSGQDDALLDIYRKLRPGEPPTREAAQTLLENLYFNPKRYDLARVGRYKINKKLGVDLPVGSNVLTIDDIVETIRFIVKLHAGETEMPAVGDSGRTVRVEVDDIDHFGNRRLRTVGELIQNQVRTGLSRMERVVRERMTTQDVEAITPQTLINIRPVVASIKEFFGTSQLSQFMDQTNPLA